MALFFQEEDINSLLEDVTPLTAAEYLGIPMKRYGANFSILCPNPEHNDQHYGSCVLSKEGRVCKCYACGRLFSALDILMLQGGYRFYDAMCVLAQLAGRESEFEASKRKPEKKLQMKRLTADEKKLLRLAGYADIRMAQNISDERPTSGDYRRTETGEYLMIGKKPVNPWISLMKEEPDTYYWLIQNKCKEQMARIDLLMEEIRNPSADKTSMTHTCMERFQISTGQMLNSLTELYNKLDRLYVMNGGKIRSKKKMAENIIMLNLVFS